MALSLPVFCKIDMLNMMARAGNYRLHNDNGLGENKKWRGFSRNPELVPEVRIMIWKLLIKPRCVGVDSLDIDRTAWRQNNTITEWQGLQQSQLTQVAGPQRALIQQAQAAPIPVDRDIYITGQSFKRPGLPIISCICRESRDVFLSLYHGFNASPGFENYSAPIYINFDIDTILVTSPRELLTLGSFLEKPLPLFPRPEVAFNRLQYLALPMRFNLLSPFPTNYENFATDFPQLKELHLYFGAGPNFEVEAEDEVKLSKPEGDAMMKLWEAFILMKDRLVENNPQIREISDTLKVDVVIAKSRFSSAGIDHYESNYSLIGPSNRTFPYAWPDFRYRWAHMSPKARMFWLSGGRRQKNRG